MEYVYHVSPVSGLNRLRPTGSHVGLQAVSQGKGGVFVAPSFVDAVKWYVSYVKYKKNSKNSNRRYRSENGKHGGHPSEPVYYQEATIYKIAVPKNFLKDFWRSNWWEREIFIPGERINETKIVSQRTYSDSELTGIYKRQTAKDWESRRGRWDAEKVAKSVWHTNVAAKKYLDFLEQYRRMALTNDERVKNHDYAAAFKHLMSRLSEFFICARDSNCPKPILRAAEGADKTINLVAALLDTPVKKFDYYDRKWGFRMIF
jgi:hypothetical protein